MTDTLISSPFLSRPRICCIDLQKEITSNLSECGYNIFEETLGSIVEVPNKRRGELTEGYVAILYLNDCKLKIGDTIILEKNGSFSKAKILSIKLNDQNVKEAEKGEIGIKLDVKVNKKTHMWTQ